MNVIRYEKVGDISSKYSFLEVYSENGCEPFMEIAITDNKELYFKTYVTSNEIELTLQHWEDILKTAKEFLPEALKDEEDYESFMKS